VIVLAIVARKSLLRKGHRVFLAGAGAAEVCVVTVGRAHFQVDCQRMCPCDGFWRPNNFVIVGALGQTMAAILVLSVPASNSSTQLHASANPAHNKPEKT
jgi:hypothetical protein